MSNIKADGTKAKDIALHFLDVTQTRATSAIIGKTIVQAKRLLEANYSKEEIIEVINFLYFEKNVDMYSLGYVSHAINNTLREMKDYKNKEEEILLASKIQEEHQKMIEESKELKNSDSQERNKNKLDRFGIKHEASIFSELFDEKE